MVKKAKTTKQLERYFKGVANHYRLAILLLVASQPGITVEEITKCLAANFKTISQHTRYLAQSGLLNKSYKGRMVAHKLSPYGKIFAKFIERFQNYL